MVQAVSHSVPSYTRQAFFDTERMAGTVSVWNDSSIEADTSSDLALSLNNENQNQKDITPPSLSFGELVDIINPLQHLPIVNDIYRSVTGDEISSVARIAGGALYGGGIGGLTSLAMAAIEEHTGTTVADALVSSADNDKPYYALYDEPRTAGWV